MRAMRLAIFAFLAAVFLFSPTVRADVGDNSLGINTHVPANDLLDMCVDLGVSWIRIDGNWLSMNPSAGTWSFTELDRVVNEARTRGLSVYMSLGYTPDWVPKQPRTRSDSNPGNDEPLGSTEWVAFVEESVRHYRPLGVTHFGMWNEANLGGFWDGNADAYIDKILIPGADAVRRVCGDCKVLGPDLAHVGDYDVFLDRVLSRAMSRFDILAHHIYQSWPELGVSIFDGDTFLQALEARRFTFTRISLRELLDARGWTGEVWITETGNRAGAIGDATAEANQATFVRRVMEEQLGRPWWTNSFFYEIMDCGVDDPACDIDGFGITRPTRALSSGGPRTFPDDYRLKPAYLTIRGFIMDHPEIVMRAPPPACADGMDNDGDGRVDSRDRGCTDGTDDNEADDPPRRRLEALPAPSGGITVDGDLGEWGTEGRLVLSTTDWQGVVPLTGAGDLAVEARARWQTGQLYLAFTVTDDVHVNDDADDLLWLSDSLQLAFDGARNYGDAYDDTDDHEINFALARGATRGYRFLGPGGASDGWSAMVARSGSTTVYEIALPATTLSPTALAEGSILGFSFVVNDDDGETTMDGTGREGWMELTPGIGTRKEPYAFGELRLVRMASPPDAGVGTDGGPGTDGGATSDGGSTPAGDGSSVTRDGGRPGTSGGGDACGCVAAGAGERSATVGWSALWVLLGLSLRRCRRRSRAASRPRRNEGSR